MYEYEFIYLGKSMVKYANDFFLMENIHKLKLNILKSWIVLL
jgi:hypothetical protein